MAQDMGGGPNAGVAATSGGWTHETMTAALAEHGTLTALSRSLGGKPGRGTLSYHANRLGVTAHQDTATTMNLEAQAGSRTATPGVTLLPGGINATAVLPPGADLGDLEALLRERGLDPDEWIVERVTVNEWEALAYGGGADGVARTVKLHQLKAHLLSVAATIRPAAEVAKRHTPRPRAALPGRPRLVVVMGDQQAPYHDHELHATVLRWLADVRPDQGVLTGDTMDFPTISRHQDRINWSASAQECVDAGYALLSDYVDANPGTGWGKLRGNHDWRLESELMSRAERMAFLAPAQRPGKPHESHLYSVRRLLHLDALGITLHGIEGEDWRYGEVRVAPGVVVRHEPPSAAKAARLNRTVLAGHTHRQAVTPMTSYDEDDNPVVRSVVQVGCLCRTREGLGYTQQPDWQAGFATVAVYPDGTHHVDLAEWRGGVLTWRGDRW